MANDAFSQWLGVEVLLAEPGHCQLQAEVREEMTNGFAIAHGGITYSLADSALAFASNGHGMQAVSVETSISHVAPVKAGDVLWVEAIEEQRSKRFGRYKVEVKRGEQTVALFRGTVFITDKPWNL